MIVQEEDELAERSELVRQGLRELRETPFEAMAAIQERRQLLAEPRCVAPQSADQVGEQHERILVATLEGEPGRATAGCAQEVRVLREHRRLSITCRGVHEREAMTFRAREPIEQSLPPEERKR
jgi:Arc/MetJ-type ribon-helix-helix transcriptional regulator